MESNKYDIWVGSDLGLIKGVTLSNDSFTNYGDIKTLDKSQSITCMCWRKTESQNNVLVGLRNGVVKTFDANTFEYNPVEFASKQSPIIGLLPLADESIVSCTEGGCLQQWKNNESIFEKSLGPDIKAMAACHTPEIFATGGIENDLKIWQIELMDKPLFSAKNVKNDFLNIRVPVWVSAIDFFNKDTNKIAVGSGHHTIRVYDRRDKRRPVLATGWHEHPITAISMKPGNAALVVGNSAGYMGEVDLRTGKQVAGYKGNAGSIRSIVYHPTQPIIAVCGLDRFLKIYDSTSKKLIKKIYMKSSLNSLLMKSSPIQLSQSTAGEKRPVDDTLCMEEEDNLWNSMETVKANDNKKSKKKKKKQ